MNRIKKFLLWSAIIAVIVLGLYIAARIKAKNNAFFCQLTGGRWQDRDASFGDDVKVFLTQGCYYSDVLIRK